MSTKTDELRKRILEYVSNMEDPVVLETFIGDLSEYVTEEIMSLFKSQQLSLIERIEKEVIGEDEVSFGRSSRNELRDEQREKTAALRKELE